MNRYRLYRHYNKSILTKHYANAAGLNNLADHKLFWSLWISDVGIGIVKYNTGVVDNNVINTIQCLVRAAVWGEIALNFYDTGRKISSNKKLNELSKKLIEKGIYFDITGIQENIDIEHEEDLEHNVIVTIKSSDGSKIISKNDEVITYYDADKQIDITDDVKKSLLSKRQYKKYCNKHK